MLRLELNGAEAHLVELLLVKELEETRVEVHHARNLAFKSELQDRERLVTGILEQVRHLVG